VQAALPFRNPPARPASGTHPLLLMNSDGASRGNPGPASIGVVLATPEGRVVDTIKKRLGRTTNNVAEYSAVLAGLSRALELGADSVVVRADSELAIRQLNGVYKVKNEQLRPLFDEIKRVERHFPGKITYQHVRREQNAEADALANQALDSGD
jgi:ribonuclease HI